MANYQDDRFLPYAGQLVKDGIGVNLPLANLEEGTVAALNQAKIQGLSPKIKDIFIRETRVFSSPIEPYVTKWESRYGAGIEQAVFQKGSANAKLDGKCMPWGNPQMVSQTNVTNYAYDVDVSVNDHEVDTVVLDEGQLGSYVSQKLATALQTVADEKYRAWIQLISDVIDGTRTLQSKTSSAGVGTDVTYNPAITGYAGQVFDSGWYVPTPERGSVLTLDDASIALGLAQQLQAVARDFRYAGSDFNKLGADTFSTGTPLLIMESKTLDAMDNAFSIANLDKSNAFGFAGFPTVSFREFVSRFAEIVSIDSFASLPTNASYANMRLGAVLIDRDAFLEKVNYADVESFRCAKERATGYSYQGSSALCIWRGVNSYAVLFDTTEPSPPGP